MSNQKSKQTLINSKKEIFNYLTKVIKDNSFNYRTFGTAIEEHVTDKLIDIFKKKGFIRSEEDYHLASNKNEFPDFILLNPRPPLAIEIKSGNHSKKSKNGWVKCGNSNNDMGTLNMWEKKLKEFGGENIYFLFVEYDFNDSEEKIVDIKIEPFYKFIGLNREGLLRYREKDGNLRPKDFNAPSPIKSLDEFNALFGKTVVFRSKRIVKKHFGRLSKSEQAKLLGELD